MGNYRFRFSDILPNAWFYKLRDITRTNNNNVSSTYNNRKPNKKLLQPPPPPPSPPSEVTKLPLPSSDHRKSYHITRERELTPPRKSSRIRTRRRDEKGVAINDSDFEGLPDLPPIITKKQNQNQRGLAANSPGVRLRGKVVSRRVIQGRRSGSWRRTESFAVVKRSEDPGRDFRESMVEMISENNIRASKDLEELLACYLSLNSDEYHQVIIDVFKQIWFEKKRK